jgi:antitoxin MazE
MKTAIRKVGNSHAVIIPKPLLAEIGAKAADRVDMTVQGGKIVIAPIKKRPREGWAEDSKALAAAGNDRLAWPEFGNEGDEDLQW